MPNPSTFQDKKRRILEDLATPSEEYTDLSPKGSVDEGVRELCDEINALEGYVTTSSCAGRIAVYMNGSGKDRSEDGRSGRTEREAGKGGKGGGEWLFVTHDAFKTDEVSGDGEVFKSFGIEYAAPSVPTSAAHCRLVYLKFEPMILHILTSSAVNAQTAYAAAYNSGFRESGIWSITGTDPTPYVAVRTQGLALESVVAYVDSNGTIKPMVTEQYLRSMLEVANERFASNAQRKERFRHAFLSTTSSRTSPPNWEPTDVRNARKRAEGLKRKEELEKQKSIAGANAVVVDPATMDDDELFPLDHPR
ncbi:tRNA wybutosine-synthesizing protein 3 [Fulvia fulva]|uniref:tRNA(Phe) 7-[(3-amino-3-carboxypropyl)-4-demethylwyosine(37)-N(4)]-methyltransferase n=1 Tax=Passalora fulva TaxID=5499 RepID=A0A9Q8P406_PASFU|nr:tRNA wybutosine-synthesizing protein 3 [Fulvia fulva]KAK4634800.1 tRNA wybutosine-synthesizing protein 3 [Fulvia fulva]UJO12570.1 tRNA wybutosine-synthesizing protein 3 [Fulvia fulva]WPV09712.1 tRNA wybutosine-synthesizing protein 3 [Fulvia fulva]WPV25167.1 tRNA wybutosine-synthesizing protein 3 [Fulvia fulva]